MPTYVNIRKTKTALKNKYFSTAFKTCDLFSKVKSRLKLKNHSFSHNGHIVQSQKVRGPIKGLYFLSIAVVPAPDPTKK